MIKNDATNIKEILINEPNEEILRQLEDPDCEGFRMLAPWATELEKAKYKLCDIITRLKRENDISYQGFSESLGIDKSRAKSILLHHYEKFTFFELAVYLEKLALSQQAKIEQIEQRQQYEAITQ